jgi:hypothetical protein
MERTLWGVAIASIASYLVAAAAGFWQRDGHL